jgi:hypothetical protein
MEFKVYDTRLGALISVALISGYLAAVGTGLLLRGVTKMPTDFYFFQIFPLGGIALAVFVIAQVTFNVRIRIERETGEVFRLYALFGREVRRQRFNLPDFDRVSLNRGFRSGYRVFMLGREQDLMICFTAKLGSARDRADQVAAECGLKVSDNL